MSYKAIAGWAKDLGTKARERFGCRIENWQRLVPSESVIRDQLIRVDPDALDRAFQRWNADYGQTDKSMAINANSRTTLRCCSSSVERPTMSMSHLPITVGLKRGASGAARR